MLRLSGLLLIPTLWVAFSSSQAADSAADVFEQRIMPIFRSPDPSSCVQCHLASVDLKDYIKPSHEATFLSLRDQGLIDLANPEKSKILSLIRMGDVDEDAMAKRIHEKTRKAELEAFAMWIQSSCDDPELVARAPLSSTELAKPAKPDAVIRHARKDRVLDSFVRNIWSQRMRCFPCHTPGEIQHDDPKHPQANERYQEYLAKYGAKMNLFQETPEATMRAWHIDSKVRLSAKKLPLINLADPAKSLLVLKPTSKVPGKNEIGELKDPSGVEPVSHVGGLKMHVGDISYKSFLAWIEDVAKLKNDGYTFASDLPDDNWYPSQQVLKLTNVPEAWPTQAPLQVLIFAKSDGASEWSKSPIAMTQGVIGPKRNVFASLVVLRSGANSNINWDSSGAVLPSGDYKLSIYSDAKGKLETRASAMLDQEDFVGELVVSAQWKEGFPNAASVSCESLSQ